MGFWPYFRQAHSSVGVLPSPTPLGRGALTSASGTVTTRFCNDRLFPLGDDVVDGAEPGPEESTETPSPRAFCSPPDIVPDDTAPSLHSPSIRTNARINRRSTSS